MQFMWRPTWNDLSEVFQVIRGLDEGIMQVSVGQKARLKITSDYGVAKLLFVAFDLAPAERFLRGSRTCRQLTANSEQRMSRPTLIFVSRWNSWTLPNKHC